MFDLPESGDLVHLLHAGSREELAEDLGFLLQRGGVFVNEFVRHGLERLFGVDDLAGGISCLVFGFLGLGFGFLGLFGSSHFFCRGRGGSWFGYRRGLGYGITGSRDGLASRFLLGLFELPEKISEFGCISGSHRAFPPVYFREWQPGQPGKLPKYWAQSEKPFRIDRGKKPVTKKKQFVV